MTMWELAACIEGVNYANNPDAKVEPPSDEEFEQMLATYDHLGATKQ
jgi:hypothetical protein